MAAKETRRSLPIKIYWVDPPQGPDPGGSFLYKPYRYVPPKRVQFLRRLGLKTGVDFTHFGLESGMKGTTGVYKRICRFNSKNKREENGIIFLV